MICATIVAQSTFLERMMASGQADARESQLGLIELVSALREAHTQDGDFLLGMIDYSIKEFGEATVLNGFRIDEETRAASLASAH